FYEEATKIPRSTGRYFMKRFRKSQCPIVERLTNSLMMHGSNNGMKFKVFGIIKHSTEIIHFLTDQNPFRSLLMLSST
ncbi:hypothetical protein RYX36_025239, partial [Vicia faba]